MRVKPNCFVVRLQVRYVHYMFMTCFGDRLRVAAFWKRMRRFFYGSEAEYS
jgi:hypothetical protein